MVAAGVVGVSVALGMIKMMSVGDDTRVIAGSATSVADVGTPPFPTVTLRAATTSRPPAPASTGQALPASPATTAATPPETNRDTQPPQTDGDGPTTTAASLTTVAMAPITTVAIAPNGQPAVLWDGGRYAIASADGLSVNSLTTVQLSSGTTHHAAVVLISDGLALIALPTPVSDAVSPLAPMPLVGDQLSVESSVGSRRATLEVSSDGAPSVRAEAPVTEGCAVRNAVGSLVGITNHSDGTSAQMISAARIDELVRSADSVGAWIGINGSSPDGSGATITDILPGSPADIAGMLKGDQLTAVDGVSVASVEHFAAMMRTFQGGQTVTVTLVRDGAPLTVSVSLIGRTERPVPPAATTTQPTSATQSPPQNEGEPSESTQPDETHSTE
jgi:S1-C subfamily serine protease